MAFLNWFKNNKPSKKGIVGVEVGDNGVAFAHLKTSPAPELLSCEHLTAPDDISTISKLRESISSLQLQGTPCNATLRAEDYSLLLVEAPKVPEDELRDAMQWKIKDLSPIPVDKAIVDVFRMPEDAGLVGKGMVFTVVAKKSAVESLVSLVDSVGLTMNAIDIPELALRNFSLLGDSPNQSLLIARLIPDGSQELTFSAFSFSVSLRKPGKR